MILTKSSIAVPHALLPRIRRNVGTCVADACQLGVSVWAHLAGPRFALGPRIHHTETSRLSTDGPENTRKNHAVTNVSCVKYSYSEVLVLNGSDVLTVNSHPLCRCVCGAGELDARAFV